MTAWLPHTGGPCPVSAATLVQIHIRSDEQPSEKYAYEARKLRWSHRRDGGDIVAYRPAP